MLTLLADGLPVEAEFAVGSRVNARGLPWDVTEVMALGSQSLLRLRCSGGDLDGMEWQMLHPAEAVEPVRSEFRPDQPGPLSAWLLYHQACLLDQVLGPDDTLLAEPGRVRIEPYQLVPLMRALELPRPRLLLADGVGLGKTIEAGLIISEIIVRRRGHRVLVISPAGPLLVQWSQELRQRFGLRFVEITNAGALQEQRRRLELGGNPFDGIALCLVSLDFAKQERVLEELERSAWDLAVIDEAHHCIGSSASTDRDDTQRRRLAEVVARRSDGLLLLTATPHDGHDEHFSSLIELLDASLVDGHGGVAGNAYRRHVVRRLKSHIRDAAGRPLFRERQVIPVRIDDVAEPAREFHRALAALIAPRLRRTTARREHADTLAFVSLLKRSVSTIGACVATLRVVAERYAQAERDTEASQRERARALRAYRKRLLRFGVLDEADEADMAELEAEGMAAELRDHAAAELATLTGACATADAMQTLIRIGQRAEAFDPKLAAVVREVETIRSARPAANILIYTEYADSQLAALRALRNAQSIDGEVLAISGIDPEAERTRIAERCAEHDGIILVSTDTLAEGLNLQQRCCNLIHLDLPYNPNRLEQRNGRIDRYGQTEEPRIRYLYLSGTFEERLLLRLIAKYETARAHLSFMPDTLGVTADQTEWDTALVAGFAERQASLFEAEPSVIRTLDRVAEETEADSYRELLHEIDRAFDNFERFAVRHGWLMNEPGHADVEARGGGKRCRIDLPAFVAAAVAAETGGQEVDPCRLPLPAEWQAGLDNLPGFDQATGILRVTRDRTCQRDTGGRSLAFLGRAHPVVRRACSRAQLGSAASSDNRVSVARSDAGAAVLLTFIAALRSRVLIELQWMIAVLLRHDAPAKEIREPDRWLSYATSECSAPDIWRKQFANWVPRRLPEAEAVARASMQRAVARFDAGRRQDGEHRTADLLAWLQGRANHVCGPYMPRTGDLFGDSPGAPEWQSLPDPLDRLTRFAADGGNGPAQRRDAIGTIEIFRRRQDEIAARANLLPAMLRPAGMLMLVP